MMIRTTVMMAVAAQQQQKKKKRLPSPPQKAHLWVCGCRALRIFMPNMSLCFSSCGARGRVWVEPAAAPCTQITGMDLFTSSKIQSLDTAVCNFPWGQLW